MFCLFLLGMCLSWAADLTAGLSVMPCTRNTTNVDLNLKSGPVKGFCRFIENNAHHHEGMFLYFKIFLTFIANLNSQLLNRF